MGESTSGFDVMVDPEDTLREALLADAVDDAFGDAELYSSMETQVGEVATLGAIHELLRAASALVSSARGTAESEPDP